LTVSALATDFVRNPYNDPLSNITATDGYKDFTVHARCELADFLKNILM